MKNSFTEIRFSVSALQTNRQPIEPLYALFLLLPVGNIDDIAGQRSTLIGLEEFEPFSILANNCHITKLL